MKRLLSFALAACVGLSLAGCAAPSAAPSSAAAATQAQSAPQGELPPLTGVYTYNEHLELGGQTIESVWTLDLREDGSYQLDTELMGQPARFTGSYRFGDEPGRVTTDAPSEGAPAMVAFFNEDGSCDWQLNPDGTCAPAGAGAGLPALSGESGAGSAPEGAQTVQYAQTSDSQYMDLYLPDAPTGHDPVLVLVHGGGFQFGDPRMALIQPVIAAGRANGYVVASVEYRKSGEAVFPAALADVKAAVRYLRANAEEYGIDPDKVVAWGESAGAYLALMTALTPTVDELNGDVTDNAGQSSAVAALVDFYGPVEFFTMQEQGAALGMALTTSEAGSFESRFLGQPVGEDEAFTARTHWAAYTDQLPDGFALSAWVQAGDADSRVPCTQSEEFAAALGEVIGEEHLRFGLLPGADHEDPQFYTEENLNAVFAWLREVLA